VGLKRATGRTDHAALDLLYAALARFSPTLGVRVAQAAARGEAGGPEAGLALLDGLSAAAVERYQPYWAVRARLLVAAGATGPARLAYARAAGLAEDPAVRVWLQAQAARLG